MRRNATIPRGYMLDAGASAVPQQKKAAQQTPP